MCFSNEWVTPRNILDQWRPSWKFLDQIHSVWIYEEKMSSSRNEFMNEYNIFVVDEKILSIKNVCKWPLNNSYYNS